jgi:aqualysin 1
VRRVLVLLILVLGVSTLGIGTAPADPPSNYIVVFKDSVSSPQAVANEHARDHGAQVRFVYTAALKGYAANIPNDRVAEVRSDDRVAYMERDQTATAVAQTVPWGITKVGAAVSSTRAGDGTGAVGNVNVFVIDSGIYSHPDLNLRSFVNFAGGPNKDCNGHGTHVAGTAAARDNTSDVVGVAPGAPLYAVKVLGCNGSGYYSGIIKGVDWVTAHTARPAVANMSLGGPPSQALDDAIRRSAAAGVVYALAAGNSGANACNSSPSRVGPTDGVITVAATDSADKEASFSNYGSCVDIWAPGVGTVSTRNGGGTTTMSGTSMASPHAAGGAALYLSTHPLALPSAVEAALKSAATTTGTTSKDGRSIKRESVASF